MKRDLQETVQWFNAFSFVPGRTYNVRTLQSSSYLCVDFVEAEFEAGEVRTYWAFGAGTLVVPVPWETSIDVISDMFQDADDACLLVPVSPHDVSDPESLVCGSPVPVPSPLRRYVSESIGQLDNCDSPSTQDSRITCEDCDDM